MLLDHTGILTLETGNFRLQAYITDVTTNVEKNWSEIGMIAAYLVSPAPSD